MLEWGAMMCIAEATGERVSHSERHGGELDGRKFVPLGKTRHFPAGRRITALLFYQAFGTKENIQLLTLPGGKYSDLSLRKCLLLSHLAQSPVPGTSGPQ